MRFHLIDRIDRIEPNQRVCGRKFTSHGEDYWRDDGRGLEMPPCLVFEALCQAGTWLIMTSTDLSRRAALLSVDSLVFGEAVRPGDVLALEGNVEAWGPETAVLSGFVSVGERTVLTAENIMCALMPATGLQERAAIDRMHQQLLRDLPRIAA
jgi:3-hydroxyacyl-[acyl-carrier-protein] dehydratase